MAPQIIPNKFLSQELLKNNTSDYRYSYHYWMMVDILRITNNIYIYIYV